MKHNISKDLKFNLRPDVLWPHLLSTNILKGRCNVFFSFFSFYICSVLWYYAIRMVEIHTPFNSWYLLLESIIKQPPATHCVFWSTRHGNKKTLEEVRLYINICSRLGCFPNCKNVRENMKKMCTICLEKECFMFYANVSFFFYFLTFF